MSRPKFSNRQNERIHTQDGRPIWLSRACAVVAQVCLYHAKDRRWYILLGKRGSGTADFQDYWGLPCGYLDWDETLSQAMVREVYEECGVYLPGLKQHPQFIWSENACINSPENFEEVPWTITDRPRTQKQNVSMHYAVLFSWRGAPLPELSDANAEPNEVAGIDWLPIEHAMEMSLAFDHEHRIRRFYHEQQERLKRVEAPFR